MAFVAVHAHTPVPLGIWHCKLGVMGVLRQWSETPGVVHGSNAVVGWMDGEASLVEDYIRWWAAAGSCWCTSVASEVLVPV